MIRVISSPSISTTGVFTLIFAIDFSLVHWEEYGIRLGARGAAINLLLRDNGARAARAGVQGWAGGLVVRSSAVGSRIELRRAAL
jgi:hypothetical protein